VITDPALLSQIDTAIAYADNLLRTASVPMAAGGGTSTRRATRSSRDGPALRSTIRSVAGRSADPQNHPVPAEYAGDRWFLDQRHNGLGTRLASTSFVMAYLPKALERLGGIDVDLHLDLPANIQLSTRRWPATTFRASTAARSTSGNCWASRVPGVPWSSISHLLTCSCTRPGRRRGRVHGVCQLLHQREAARGRECPGGENSQRHGAGRGHRQTGVWRQ